MRSTRRAAGSASFRTIRWARTRTVWRLSGCPSAVVTSAPAGYAEHCAGHVGCGLGEAAYHTYSPGLPSVAAAELRLTMTPPLPPCDVDIRRTAVRAQRKAPRMLRS